MDETSNKWRQTVRCVVRSDLSGHAEFWHQYIFELYFSVLVFGRPFVKRFALCYRSIVLSVCPVCLSVCLSVCNVRAQWPNGWTDQDETWHAGKPRPSPHCVRWVPSSPSPKGAQPPIFGPYKLRPNGCMDQDVTWYGARPGPRWLCVRWGPRSPSQKGDEAPKFSAHVYCAQTAGWMNLIHSMEVGLSPRRLCVRWGPSTPPQKGAEPPPQFSAHFYCGQTAGWMKMPLIGTEVDLGSGHIVLNGFPAPAKGAQSPQFWAHVCCGQAAGWINIPLLGRYS